jgi:hypothetical protein
MAACRDRVALDLGFEIDVAACGDQVARHRLIHAHRAAEHEVIGSHVACADIVIGLNRYGEAQQHDGQPSTQLHHGHSSDFILDGT